MMLVMMMRMRMRMTIDDDDIGWKGLMLVMGSRGAD